MLRKSVSLFMFFIIIISGCSAEKEKPSNFNLKVLAWNETIFNRQYGSYFLATHPDANLEVISIIETMDPETNVTQTIENLINKESPDVVSVPMESYLVLRDSGKLSSLTKLVQSKGFDLTAFSPAVIEFLQDEQGQLYGLTPVFTGQALYYNKDLFDRYGITYPTDQMTWDELFKLAQRFPEENGNNASQYGLYHKDASNPFLMALKIGESSGLSFSNNEQITLYTESWSQIFKNVTDCFKTNVCYDPNGIKSNDSTRIEQVERSAYPFLIGNIAMAIDESTLYKTLTNTARQQAPVDFDWGTVSLPVSADHPNTGNSVYMNEIFAVPTVANEPDGAWEFLQYVSGENYAKLLPQINTVDLPTRPNLETMDEREKSFYHIEHVNITLINQMRKFPLAFLPKIDEISQKHMGAIMSEQHTVRDALQSMEEEIEFTLEQLDAD
ncbi:ABC transporter substrate-binding protein [Paenibacillus sp. M1]|uniref:ABC transporter substrate-binding protein n=1 Tax=Paenibacillus haidiansis TaxID=1574488 RepID=A0ABU7VMG2_9BACL